AHQVWVGPRALVTVDGEEGYISDEIPATLVGCPLGWKAYMMPGESDSDRNFFAVRWVKPPGAEFLQVAKAMGNVAVRVAALARGGKAHTSDTHVAEAPHHHSSITPPAHLGEMPNEMPPPLARADSTVSPRDSLAHAWAALVDTVKSLVHHPKDTTTP